MTRNCEPAALAASPSPERNLPENQAQPARRKWEVFPGKNRFCCDGRIMLAKRSGLLPLTLGLIVVTCGLFFILDCPFLVQRVTVFIPVIAGVLFVFVVFFLLRTSLTDPGILPRAKDPAADTEKQIGSTPPRAKEIIINQQVVKLKYCSTCNIFRPPRTSHCSQCDNCVERFDHHCPWVGNCVGKRNYRFFYSFITSLSLLTSFILGCVITHITLRSKETGFCLTIKENPASVVELVICHFSIWFILGLLGYHTYLLASNLTTKEDGAWSRRKGARKSRNPYSSNNICTNCTVTLCGPMPPSVIDRRGFVPPDELDSPAASEQAVLTVRRDTHVVEMG